MISKDAKLSCIGVIGLTMSVEGEEFINKVI